MIDDIADAHDGKSRRATELLAWLASLPPERRDAALEERWGIGTPAPSSHAPGEHLVGYHASGVAPIVRALIEVPVVPDDVVIDLGAGLGKVVLLTRMLTFAVSRGIELQDALVERAREAAARAGVHVAFSCGGVLDEPIEDGSVFYLYAPFTGPVLEAVLDRLRALAERRAIVVCALGIDLPPTATWLSRRETDAFWLAIYDSVMPGVPPRAHHRSHAWGPATDAIVNEEALRPTDTP